MFIMGCCTSRNYNFAKNWPFVHVEKLVKIFKEKYPGIKVVQLGSAGTLRIGGVEECFLGENLELGYEENINVLAGDYHGCHCLYDGFDACARGMEQPECMWGITPEMVMDRVKTWINSCLPH